MKSLDSWWKYWITDCVLGVEVYFTENDDEKIIAYVAWYSPGTGPFATQVKNLLVTRKACHADIS